MSRWLQWVHAGRRRLVRIRIVQDLAWSAVVGAGTAALFVLAVRLALPVASWQVIAAASAAATSFCFVALAMTRPWPLLHEAALQLDAAHGLNERLISALHATQQPGPFTPLVTADAEAAVSALRRPATIGQIRIGRPMAAALLSSAVALLAWLYMPSFDLLHYSRASQQRAREADAVAQETAKVTALAKALATPAPSPQARENATTASAEAAAAMEALRRALAEDAAKPDARAALAKLATATERIEEQRREAARAGQTEVSRAPASDPRQEAPTAALERALRRGDMAAAQQELQRLENLAGADGRQPENQKALGEALSQLAGRIAGQKELSSALDKAGAALKNGQPDQAKAALAEARETADKIAGAQKEAVRLAEALDRLEQSKQALADAASAGNSNAPQGSPNSGSKEGSGDNAPGKNEENAGKAGADQPNNSASGNKSQAGNKAEGQAGANPNNGNDTGAAGDQQTNGKSGAQPASQAAGPESSNSPQGQSAQGSGQSGSSTPEASPNNNATAGTQQPSDQPQAGNQPGTFEVGMPSTGNSPSNSGSTGESQAGGDQQAGENSSGGDQQSGGQQSGGQQAGGQQSGGQQGGQSGTQQAGGQRSGGQQQGGSQQGGQQQGGQAMAGSTGSQGGSQGQSGGKSGDQNSGRPDYGVGTTNLDQGRGNTAEKRDHDTDRQADGRTSRWNEEFIKLYDPKATATNGTEKQVKGKLGEGKFTGGVEVPGQLRREAARTQASRAFLDWREAKKDSLVSEEIPRGYRQFVKGYFDSIEPPADAPTATPDASKPK